MGATSISRLADAESREKQASATVAILRAELAAITTPVVLTEGRTDAKLLLLAWQKLRGGVPPFAIRTCETGGESAGSGNGGANSLAIRLKGIPADHAHTVIGLFDYDAEGIAAYKLDRNFVETTIGGFKVKRGMHGRAYAAYLQIPDFRKECQEYKNLPIEFLFRDAELNKELNHKKLDLVVKKATTMVGDKKIEKALDDFTWFKDVRGGKSDFAETIAPNFDDTAFAGFKPTIAMIEAIFQNDAAN